MLNYSLIPNSYLNSMLNLLVNDYITFFYVKKGLLA